MKVEPLKEKWIISENIICDAKYYDCDSVKNHREIVSDVRGAVKWLKQRISKIECSGRYATAMDIYPLIDEAFADLGGVKKKRCGGGGYPLQKEKRKNEGIDF